MSDSYQAIYDATRSKIQGGSVSDAIESAFRDSGFSHYAQQAFYAWQIEASEQSRPSVLYKPKIYIDGDKWCALYGENIQDGVAGFGNSPREAMNDFDTEWNKPLNKLSDKGE
jgi:hypothetical protein